MQPLGKLEAARDSSATVARMVARGSLVSALVVSSDASHQLLRLLVKAAFQFVRERQGRATAKRGSYSAVMQDLDITVLSRPMSETEIAIERRMHRDLVVDCGQTFELSWHRRRDIRRGATDNPQGTCGLGLMDCRWHST